jgi:O-methyltransferase
MLSWLRTQKKSGTVAAAVVATPATATVAAPVDMERDVGFMRRAGVCRPYTLTTFERLYGLDQAVQYVQANGVEGDIVECGVWMGGSMMMCALALLDTDAPPRTLWLYDTFTGMSAPGPQDLDLSGKPAADILQGEQRGHFLCQASLANVRQNLRLTGYPETNLRYIAGKVEETLPREVPERIALLRLDTDWYSSTRHELEHLYPRLTDGGVLIIDDYGHWEGARKAVDEYFAAHGLHPLLSRLDYSGRMMVKRGPS